MSRDQSGPAARDTGPFFDLLPRLIHEAIAVNGVWCPRCRPRLEWKVPLAQTVSQVTCVDCIDFGLRGARGD